MSESERKHTSDIGGETLLLKWGSLKGWNLETDASKAALKRYFDDPVLASAAMQRNTPGQKQALCDLIDCLGGEIANDWSGETMTKAEAKKYVSEYGQEREAAISKATGPAYPNYVPNADGSVWIANGISKRDHFAGLAMQVFAGITGDEERTLEGAAEEAYAQADAMLAARATPQPDPVRDELEAIKEQIGLARRTGAADPKGTAFNNGLQRAVSIVNAALSKAKEGTK